nr:Uncharacterised protein [Raoultella sp. NCTC 9187]
MEDHADILQQRIEIPAIDGIQRQRAGEGVRGEQNKQQKAEGDHPITASTLATASSGMRRLSSATAKVQTLSSSTHSSREPSWAPQVAATRYHTGSALLEFPPRSAR